MSTRRWTSEEVNRVAHETAAWMGFPRADWPTMSGWTEHRGVAYREERRFTLPEWVLAERDEYVIAYIVHEVCHFSRTRRGDFLLGHDALYRAIEERALAYWNLTVLQRSPHGNRYMKALAGPDGQAIPARTTGHRTATPCECGCGKYPKGLRSRFLPGHDARAHRP